MEQKTISDANLLAYLHGEKNPKLEMALKTSGELRQRLSEFNALDNWLFAMFDGIERPLDSDMIDVAAGQANAQQKLSIAAYERDSMRGRQEMKLLREEAKPPRSKPNRLIAQLVTQVGNLISFEPQTIAASRSAGREEDRYLVEELNVEIQLQITTPIYGETWKMTGDIYHLNEGKEPAANVCLWLQSARGGRARRAFTNSSGYFEFLNIRSGNYHLVIEFAQQIAEIRDLKCL